jgi:hypothetical protein
MKNEFNLSLKRTNYKNDKDYFCYKEEDVKEFIRLLKKKVPDYLLDAIDKLGPYITLY